MQVLGPWQANPSVAPAQAAWSLLEGRPGKAQSSPGPPLPPPTSGPRGFMSMDAPSLPLISAPQPSGQCWPPPWAGEVIGAPEGGVGVT